MANILLMYLCFQTPEMSSVATSPIKPTQEEQSLTPPGKVVTISTRSPGCTRNQSALRNNKTFSPAAASSSSGEYSYKSVSVDQTLNTSYHDGQVPVVWLWQSECYYCYKRYCLRTWYICFRVVLSSVLWILQSSQQYSSQSRRCLNSQKKMPAFARRRDRRR